MFDNHWNQMVLLDNDIDENMIETLFCWQSRLQLGIFYEHSTIQHQIQWQEDQRNDGVELDSYVAQASEK